MKTSTIIFTPFLILGLLALTSPSFAQVPEVVHPRTTRAVSAHVADYLPPVPKPVEDTSFKLLTKTSGLALEWPKATTVAVMYLPALPLWAVLIVVTIAIIVAGLVIYVIICALRALDRILNPTNRPPPPEGGALLSVFGKASTSSLIGTPRETWELPAATALESSTNLADWSSYAVVSNSLMQMDNTDLYLMSSIYRGGLLLTSVVNQVFATEISEYPHLHGIEIEQQLPVPVVKDKLREFFRGTGSNYFEPNL